MTFKKRILLPALLLVPCLTFAQSPVKATAEKLEPPVKATAQKLDTTAESLGQSVSHALAVQPPFDPADYKPLSGQQRWQRWLNEDGRSPSIHIESIATATYLQVIPDPSAWGRTGGGYARRLGSSYGSNLIQNTVHESMAGMAGTDPRYFACSCTGFFHRSGHAMKMTLITYNRSGQETLDIPQLSGAYGSSMIEAMWWPRHYTALTQGVQTGHLEMGFIGAEHLAQEFAPELKRLLHLRF